LNSVELACQAAGSNVVEEPNGGGSRLLVPSASRPAATGAEQSGDDRRSNAHPQV
jgi:hypothetical protein